MRYLLYGLFLGSSVCAMMEEGNSGYHLEMLPTPDDDELTQVAVSFYFNSDKHEIVEQVIPRIRDKIIKSKGSNDLNHSQALEELNALRDKIKKRRRSSSSEMCIEAGDVHTNSQCLHDFISNIITDSVEEALSEKNAHLRRLEHAFNKKYDTARLVAGASLLGSLIVGTVSLIVHFYPQ